MRLVAYYRVSSKGQADGFGLDEQRATVQRWLTANPDRVEIVDEVEEVWTGTADDRPVLTEVLRLIRAGRVDGLVEGLILARLDRFARALTVQEAILAKVWQLDGHVVAADQGEILRDDPDDPMRTALRQMQGVMAQLDRSMGIMRMRAGIRKKREQGRHATGTYPYGWRAERKGRQVDAGHDPVEWPGVQRILELRAADTPYRAIAALLDAERIPTRNGRPWSAMAVQKVADREAARMRA